MMCEIAVGCGIFHGFLFLPASQPIQFERKDSKIEITKWFEEENPKLNIATGLECGKNMRLKPFI